jgi:Uma2 family endonuclease
MSRTQLIITADEFLTAPRLGRCELIRGQLVMMSPSGFRHGRIAATTARLLGEHVVRHDLGVVTGAETGFLIEQQPDTVRAADVAFVARDRLPAVEPTGFFVGAPTLAIEVLSPSDRVSQLDSKIREWLEHGCQEVWVIDPEADSIVVHTGPDQSKPFQHDDQLRSLLLPDFRPRVCELLS